MAANGGVMCQVVNVVVPTQDLEQPMGVGGR